MIELAFALVVAAAMPLRAWRRRVTGAPRRLGPYLVETLLLIAAISALLWRRGVPLQALGLGARSYPAFLFQVALCLSVVVAPDAWASRRIARTARLGDRLPEPDPLFADIHAGRHALGMFVAAMLVGAVWEELCFRATVLAIVQHTPAGLLLGIAAGSVVFGAQHLRNGVRRAAYACGFGAMFALLYVLTGNLVAVVTAHAAGNILGALQWTPQLERVRVETAAHPPSIFVG